MDIKELYQKQLAQSERYRTTFANLALSQTRTIQYSGFSYTLQLNPARIKSSTANISRPLNQQNCFLCTPNMPADQIKQPYSSQFFITINPYPILPSHLTIISNTHTPQTIIGNLEALTTLARDLSGMTIFYNSPKSGASAPFHMHFQAGYTQDLPAFTQIENIKKQYTIQSQNGISLISGPTRRIIVVESASASDAIVKMQSILMQIASLYNTNEPEANIGITHTGNTYRAILFPREKHRPAEYYREDNTKILISPGFADMAGIIPCSLPQNYHQITQQDITSIMNQVSMPEEKLTRIACR